MKKSLTEVVGKWEGLTSEEESIIHNSENFPIIYVLKNLSREERSTIYRSIRVKLEYVKHFSQMQVPWLKEHEYLIGVERARKHLGCSHDEINMALTKEILNSEGENVRCKLFYAAKYQDNVETTGNADVNLLEDYFKEVNEAIDMYHKGILPFD